MNHERRLQSVQAFFMRTALLVVRVSHLSIPTLSPVSLSGIAQKIIS